MRSISFTSPINEDTGTQHRFIGHAASTMVLRERSETEAEILWAYVFIDGQHRGEEEVHEIVLHINNKRLVGFEGVHELPDEAIRLLEDNGYNATLAKL